MKKYKCRRKLTVDINDDESRDIINNVTVVNPETNFCLHIPECLECGYGKKAFVLKSGNNSHKETYTIKVCTLKLVTKVI